MECHFCNIAEEGGHKYKICNKHEHLVCGTSEGEGIMAKPSRAQNAPKVKMSYCIMRHFFLLESKQFVDEKLGTKKSLSAGAARNIKNRIFAQNNFRSFWG